MSEPHPLDNPAWSSLTGPHAYLAERRGNVLRYPVDVSPFIALPEEPEAADWDAVAAMAGPGALVRLSAWSARYLGPLVTLVRAGVVSAGGELVERPRDRFRLQAARECDAAPAGPRPRRKASE
ncbi:hypothetical protein ACSDR0_37475 [Streptosporangium sp. G11]|uniref:hypothetical protein n=1 Tax=Streptosporangium sp. G11 TaxID=3436926 RepID=UPI003EBC25AD